MAKQNIRLSWGRKHLFMMMLIYIGMIVAFAVASYTILIKDLKSDLGNKAMVLAIDVTHWLDIDKHEYDRLLTLSFSELLADPTNIGFEQKTREIMRISEIKYIYLVSELPEEKAKYKVEADEIKDYNAPSGTPLKGVYVLDSVQSDLLRQEDTGGQGYNDKSRYTILRPEIKRIVEKRKPVFILNTDEWGTYLTGFAPYYTENGEFLGMLGVDLFPDKYYTYIQKSMTVFGVFLFILFIAGLSFSKLLTRVWHAEERIRLENDLATQDSLTGLINRRIFVGLLTHEYAVCRREGMPLTIMLAHLDGFARFHASKEDAAGKRILKESAEFLDTGLKRASDALCRFGGEEFAFFLHNTEAENAVAFAGRLLHEAPHPFSLGILVIMPEDPIDIDLIFEKLEAAMRQAHKVGTRKYAIMDESH